MSEYDDSYIVELNAEIATLRAQVSAMRDGLRDTWALLDEQRQERDAGSCDALPWRVGAAREKLAVLLRASSRSHSHD